jgi:hypothetical protein
MVVSKTEGGALRNGNFVHAILLVCHSPEWWLDTRANIHVCSSIFLFSYQVGRRCLLMGNGSHAHILSVGTVILKLTLGTCNLSHPKISNFGLCIGNTK